MTYKLPPCARQTGSLFGGKDFDEYWNAEQMQAAYAAGQRDMLERAIAVVMTARNEQWLPDYTIDKLKELSK